MVGRRRRLVLGAALAPVAVCGADGFAACERVRVDSAEDVRRFWEAYSADPRPVLLVSDSVKPVDFLGDRGLEPDEGVEVEDVSVGGAAHAAYILTNAAYTPRVFDKLAAEFPLPAAVESIALRPVFSIGRNGTGERDLAHHYHPITAMRLLQGRKIWALREPTDTACDGAAGDCTDPFDVCAFYERPSSPEPACVQEAGETIVVPDGWCHGTCNTARWTVGWGGQGWRAEAEPPRCFHCRARGQLQYATTTSAVLTASDALAMSARFDSIGSLDALDMRRLLRIGQAAYMGVRSVFGQFVAQSAMAAETNAAIREPACTLRTREELSGFGSLSPTRAGLRGFASLSPSDDYAYVLMLVRGAPLRLMLRHRASGEAEERELKARHAAFFVGRALEAARPSEGHDEEAVLLLECRAPMPWLSTERPQSWR